MAWSVYCTTHNYVPRGDFNSMLWHRAQWLGGRASDYRLREPGFESCAVVLKHWASVFTLHFSSSLSCTYEYLAIDGIGYVYEHRALIVAYGWMLPREVETVSD